jgi:hypothetical protein
MSYIVEKMEEQFMDAISKPESWIARDPSYAGLYEDLACTRNQHQEQGTTIHTPEWKLVAKIQTSLEGALNIVKDSGFIKDKKQFYDWLDRNPQYCAYDRRKGRRQ